MSKTVSFTSALPCPRVDLPEGGSIQFVNHRAEVSAEVADELRQVLDDGAIDSSLRLQEGTSVSPDPLVPVLSDTQPDDVKQGTDDVGDPNDLESLTVADLRALAGEKGIDVEGLKKAEIVEKLSA